MGNSEYKRKLPWIAGSLYLQNEQSVTAQQYCDRLETHRVNEILHMGVSLFRQEAGKTNFKYDK